MQNLVGYAVIAYVAWMFWGMTAQPPPSVDGMVPIPYETTRLHGWKGPSDGEGLLTITNRSGDTVAQYVVGDSGVLHEDPGQQREGQFRASFEPSLYIGRWWFDVGAFAAANTEDQYLGLRISPARLFYGTVAPDIVGSESSIGLGVSVFPPARNVGDWSHIGVGCWYLHDLDRGDNRLSLGLSTSIR
jgi:hypothetical protein